MNTKFVTTFGAGIIVGAVVIGGVFVYVQSQNQGGGGETGEKMTDTFVIDQSSPRGLGDALVHAVNSGDSEQIRMLVHPDVLSYFSEEKVTTVDLFVSGMAQNSVPENYFVDIADVSVDPYFVENYDAETQRLFIGEDSETREKRYQYFPTHPERLMQITTLDSERGISNVFGTIAPKDGKWYLIITD